MYENIHVLNFRVNIFSWEPHENILTWKFGQARNYCTSRYIIYYTSLSCATAKCSQTPALNKTARSRPSSQIQHARACCHGNKQVRRNGIQFKTLRELSMPCTWMATFEKVLCIFFNQSVMLRLAKILPACGNQQRK